MNLFGAGFLVASLMWIGLIIGAIKLYMSFGRTTNTPQDEQAMVTTSSLNTSGSEVVYYRTRNGRSDYKFRIAQIPGVGYRVHILDQPSYGSRDTGAHPTHRLKDSRGRYICWAGRIKTNKEARQVAAAWADKTEDYILRGERF